MCSNSENVDCELLFLSYLILGLVIADVPSTASFYVIKEASPIRKLGTDPSDTWLVTLSRVWLTFYRRTAIPVSLSAWSVSTRFSKFYYCSKIGSLSMLICNHLTNLRSSQKLRIFSEVSFIFWSISFIFWFNWLISWFKEFTSSSLLVSYSLPTICIDSMSPFID